MRSQTLLKSSTRAERRNPGLVLQLRLSWARVYFGSPTFSGFVMTAACSHWMDIGQRGGTLLHRLAPPHSVTCLVNSRKYVVKGIKQIEKYEMYPSTTHLREPFISARWMLVKCLNVVNTSV